MNKVTYLHVNSVHEPGGNDSRYDYYIKLCDGWEHLTQAYGIVYKEHDEARNLLTFIIIVEAKENTECNEITIIGGKGVLVINAWCDANNWFSVENYAEKHRDTWLTREEFEVKILGHKPTR